MTESHKKKHKKTALNTKSGLEYSERESNPHAC